MTQAQSQVCLCIERAHRAIAEFTKGEFEMTIENMKERLAGLERKRYGVFVSQQDLGELDELSPISRAIHEERLERRAESLDKRIDVLRNAIAAFA